MLSRKVPKYCPTLHLNEQVDPELMNSGNLFLILKSKRTQQLWPKICVTCSHSILGAFGSSFIIKEVLTLLTKKRLDLATSNKNNTQYGMKTMSPTSKLWLPLIGTIKMPFGSFSLSKCLMSWWDGWRNLLEWFQAFLETLSSGTFPINCFNFYFLFDNLSKMDCCRCQMGVQ